MVPLRRMLVSPVAPWGVDAGSRGTLAVGKEDHAGHRVCGTRGKQGELAHPHPLLQLPTPNPGLAKRGPRSCGTSIPGTCVRCSWQAPPQTWRAGTGDLFPQALQRVPVWLKSETPGLQSVILSSCRVSGADQPPEQSPAELLLLQGGP